MFKFLVKLAVLIIGILILTQLPYFQQKYADIRASFSEKAENVGEEVTRIKGKIDYAKERVDQATETITDVTTKVKDTADAVEDAFTSINKAHDAVDKMLSGEEGETTPEASKPPADEAEDGGGTEETGQ